MANEGQVHRGPLYGGLCLLIAVLGILKLLGLLGPADASSPHLLETPLGRLPGEASWAAPPVSVPLAVFVLSAGGLALGVDLLPVVILLALACLAPAASRRPALLVFVAVSAIYLPMLGATSLWDPWETHYGEVAREILSRDDWVSLWWAQDKWFFSKPILIFWIEALTMGAFGQGFAAGEVLPLAGGGLAHPEWALRLPVYLMSMGALLAVYAAVSRFFGKRAGVLVALVLATCPHFFFLSHQAITDMPLVANVTIALCLLMLAISEDPERVARAYRLGRFSVSGQALLVAIVCLLVLPQALYLISLNVTFYPTEGFAFHGDSLLYGSPGNESMGGNPELAEHPVAVPAFQPALQGALWLLGLLAVVVGMLRERRTQGLYMFGFYIAATVAFMAKGIPGVALPGLVALFYLLVSRRWELLTLGRLRVAKGILIVVVVGLPWYVAMFMRHGPAFTNRLLIHDHLNRLAQGVHGDQGSVAYFLLQLGFSLFPWVALLPAAALGWLWYGERDLSFEGGRRRDAMRFVGLWLLTSFVLFSAMATKFHHYIFPAVPAAAIAVGVFLDRIWGAPSSDAPRSERMIGSLLAMLAPIALVAGVASFTGDLRGVLPAGVEGVAMESWALENPSDLATSLSLFALGLLLAVAAGRLLPSSPPREESVRERQLSTSIGVALVAGAVVLAFVGRDLSWVTQARPQGNERLIHLFVYNYGRPWPEHLDYRAVLTAFGVVGTSIVALGAFARLRPLASRALLGLALTFTAWGLNVYMADLADHWSLRPLMARYYEAQEEAPGEVVAWQMNWKGENFYSGNHVNAFVQLNNEAVKAWIEEHRGETGYFMLEHGRLATLRRVLFAGHEVETMSDARDNNKFVLVRIEEM